MQVLPPRHMHSRRCLSLLSFQGAFGTVQVLSQCTLALYSSFELLGSLTFSQGNCKYGKRCALPHIVDGQIVNPQSLTTRPVRTQIGGAAAAPSFPNVGTSPVIPPGGAVAQMDQISYANPSHLTNNQMVSLDVPPSRFGTSPRDHGLSWSPPGPGVSALDAPLPSSFNSQEPPNIAKYGPSGASVPSRFGWDHPLGSPPSSAKAFGNLDSLALGSARASSFATQKELGSSPPTSAAAEVEPRRIMHSQQRSRPSNISSSLPVQGPLDDAYSTSAIREDDPHEEDLVPSTLDDLLTPEERFRRLSRSGDEHGLSPRPSYSSFGSPPDSKVGSPSHNSPSRFGSFFASQQAKRENQEAQAQLHGHGSGPAFGHVGSPLRNSHMNGEGKNGARFGNDPGPSPPLGPISPPAKAGHAGHNYVSSLSEQLKSVSIGRAPGTKDADGAGGTRNVSNSSASTTSAVSTGAPKYGDRAVSNSSVGRERIDEEPLFSMDDEHEPRHIKERERAKAEAATSPRRFADVVSGETPTNGSVKG